MGAPPGFFRKDCAGFRQGTIVKRDDCPDGEHRAGCGGLSAGKDWLAKNVEKATTWRVPVILKQAPVFRAFRGKTHKAAYPHITTRKTVKGEPQAKY